MSLYRPNRLPHEIMKLLARGPKTFAEIVQRMDLKNPVKGPVKVRYILESMERDHLVQIYNGVHGLTKDGTEAFQDLEDGINVPVGEAALPTVRIF